MQKYWQIGEDFAYKKMQNFVKNTAIAGGLLILATKENN